MKEHFLELPTLDPTILFFNQSRTMDAEFFLVIYVVFFGDFRCFRQVYLGKSFDILQYWGKEGCPNFAGFSFFDGFPVQAQFDKS